MSDMDKRRVAETILNLVGGADNVKEVTHCFTRLRFVLKDERIPKDEFSSPLNSHLLKNSLGVA